MGYGATGGRKSPFSIDLRNGPYNSVRTNVLHCDNELQYTQHNRILCTSVCRIFALMLKLCNKWLLFLSSFDVPSLSTDFCLGTFHHCSALPILHVDRPSPPLCITLSLSSVRISSISVQRFLDMTTWQKYLSFRFLTAVLVLVGCLAMQPINDTGIIFIRYL